MDLGGKVPEMRTSMTRGRTKSLDHSVRVVVSLCGFPEGRCLFVSLNGN